MHTHRKQASRDVTMTTMALFQPSTAPSPKFWDRIADKYSKDPVTDEAAYQKKLRISRDHFTPDFEVLEFGCGTGSTAIAHAPFVKHILANDISSRMIEIAERKAASGNISNVTFQCGAFDDFSARCESYDAVLGMSILHLVHDRDEAIRKVYSFLKPGGVFISSTACLGDRMKFFKFIGPIGKALGLIPLVRVFSTKELVDSLTSAGFEIAYQWRPEKSPAAFIVAKK